MVSLAQNGHWDSLKEYAGKKKLPVDAGSFVEVALQYKAPREVTSTFIEKVTDYSEKARLFMRMG